MTNNLFRRLAGAALVTTPALLLGAMVTSPPQDDDSPRAYIDSLARDWDLSILSANLFHYYWLAIALGIPAALTLLRGPRGQVLATIGAVATVIGAIQMSGVLFADWMNAALPTVVTMDQAVTIFDKVNGDPSMVVWLRSGVVLGLLMPAVLMAGLARNGIIGWWATPVALLPMIGGPMIGGMVSPLAGSVAGALCCAPLFLIGLRLLRRTAADVTAAEPTLANAH
ncbi:hypothetical protein M1L60_30565 [Actinoplanes sp. TRM 88003]|uniref:DUF4386 family protein n=1 Tax=Paractinoplanes aksuensis TaxID=2939490 RepID=A0ABT1DWK7_9ACTN|nr:hypothetical protein [Actinoplanes aksuensis]MCO8274933.1 hypothetical protein [Actinoplanes aksuensis]